MYNYFWYQTTTVDQVHGNFSAQFPVWLLRYLIFHQADGYVTREDPLWDKPDVVFTLWWKRPKRKPLTSIFKRHQSVIMPGLTKIAEEALTFLLSPTRDYKSRCCACQNEIYGDSRTLLELLLAYNVMFLTYSLYVLLIHSLNLIVRMTKKVFKRTAA